MQNNYVEGTIDAVFVMAGISAKSQKPYLQVSDGVEAKFLQLAPEVDIESFSDLHRGDIVALRLRSFPVSGRSVVYSRE